MLNRKSTTTTTSSAYGDFDEETPSRSSIRSAVTAREVTHEQIARRAYEIFKSGVGGTPEDNWYRAERELRARA